MNEVSLGENAAPGGYPGWLTLKFQCLAGEVLHGYTQAIGLLLQEHARPGGAQGVGGYPPRFAESIHKLNDERALPADLDDGLGVRVKVKDAGGN